MSEFLHKLAEGLRTREKLMEDHSANPVFDQPQGKPFKVEFNKLKAELDEFRARVEKIEAEQVDFDEHFEREISDAHQKLSIKIDTWQKSLPVRE